MIIKKKQLKNIIQRVLSKIELELDNDIVLKSDIYRIIPTEKWDVFDHNITDIHSLKDDVEELLKLTIDKDRPVTYVDFDRLSSLLREISEIKNPINPSQHS